MSTCELCIGIRVCSASNETYTTKRSHRFQRWPYSALKDGHLYCITLLCYGVLSELSYRATTLFVTFIAPRPTKKLMLMGRHWSLCPSFFFSRDNLQAPRLAAHRAARAHRDPTCAISAVPGYQCGGALQQQQQQYTTQPTHQPRLLAVRSCRKERDTAAARKQRRASAQLEHLSTIIRDNRDAGIASVHT